jgi:hypothetical protein
MTGVIRKATIFVALGLVAATVAMAGIPDAAHCTFPTFIKVVGTKATVPDPLGTFSITVRDIGNIPVSGSVVTLNFNAATDMKLCNGTGVTCAPAVVSATTNASGVATFTVIGGGLHPGGSFAGPGFGDIEIRASGYLLGAATANVYDLNGALAGAGKNGVLITDLPLFLADWHGTGLPYVGRSDFNQDGVITITDLPKWLAVWGPTNSSGGCATTYCP